MKTKSIKYVLFMLTKDKLMQIGSRYGGMHGVMLNAIFKHYMNTLPETC